MDSPSSDRRPPRIFRAPEGAERRLAEIGAARAGLTFNELAKLIGYFVIFWAVLHGVVGVFMVPLWLGDYLSGKFGVPLVAGNVAGWAVVTVAAWLLSKAPNGHVIATIAAIAWVLLSSERTGWCG